MKLHKNPEVKASSETRPLMSNQSRTPFPTSTYFSEKGAGWPSEARRAAIIIAGELLYNLIVLQECWSTMNGITDHKVYLT